MNLTDKQKRMLDILRSYIEQNGQSPTVTELRDMLEFRSVNSVTQFLEAIERKGCIARGRGFRSIRITGIFGEQLMLDIPILGMANAGRPLVYSDETTAGKISVSKHLIKNNPKDYFFVQINGTSMNNFTVNGKKLEDKKYALINSKKKMPNEHDAFLCIVDQCATIKKIKRTPDCIYLLPESRDESHHPLIFSTDDIIEINGCVEDVF